MRSKFQENGKYKYFFLEYANNSLKNNPDYLNDICIYVQDYIGDVEGIDIFDDITKAIFLIKNDKNHEIADPHSGNGSTNPEKFISLMIGKPKTYKGEWKKVSEISSLLDHHITPEEAGYFQRIFFNAFDTIYGCGECTVSCGFALSTQRWKLFGSNLFYLGDITGTSIPDITDNKTIKCYECDQLHIQKILDLIIANADYMEIQGFERLIQLTYDNFLQIKRHPVVKETSRNESVFSFKEIVEIPICYHDLEFDNMNGEINIYRQSILSIVIHSLLEFLTKNDRRLLKKCDYCHNYFIAKQLRINQKYCPICSPKSKMTREERKIYMRDEWRPKQRAKKEHERKQKREEQIKTYMAKLHITREEAIEMLMQGL